MKSSHLIFLLLTMTAGAASAQVFKCEGTNGKIVYADAPCPTDAKGTQVMRARSAAEVEAENRRNEAARQRTLNAEEARATSRAARTRADFQAGVQRNEGDTTPLKSRLDSYECQVAKKNLGSGTSKESKLQSQQVYESACFGDKAADIEAARAGKPEIKIRVYNNR